MQLTGTVIRGGTRREGIEKTSRPEMPLVSIITVVRNGEAHLEQTINSVLSQKYPNIEYIVIDGCSTDKTLDIIRKYDDRIDYWLSEADDGIADAMNKGVRLAHGEIIAHLHSDDYYADTSVVSDVVNEILRNPSSLWLTGGKNIINHEGAVILQIPVKPFSYKRLLRANYIFHCATFIRRRVFDQIGYFDTSLHFAMDYDLWLRVGALEAPIQIHRPLACFRFHRGSISTSLNNRAFAEGWKIRHRMYQGKPLRKVLHYMDHLMLKTVSAYSHWRLKRQARAY